MPAERFDVIFRGQIIEGYNLATVKSQVGTIFNATNSQIKQLFSGYPAVIKRAVDAETANRLRLAFRNAGALVEIRLTKDASNAVNATATNVTLTLSAPNNFSLEDCAIIPQPAPIPDIQHLTMATTGATLDRTPPPAPVNIDIKNLSLVPGQNWTLEDCDMRPRRVVLPNMRNISLSDPGVILDDTPPPKPVNIDTSTINLVTQQNWNLEDCQPPSPPPLNIDLSNLNLA